MNEVPMREGQVSPDTPVNPAMFASQQPPAQGPSPDEQIRGGLEVAKRILGDTSALADSFPDAGQEISAIRAGAMGLMKKLMLSMEGGGGSPY